MTVLLGSTDLLWIGFLTTLFPSLCIICYLFSNNNFLLDLMLFLKSRRVQAYRSCDVCQHLRCKTKNEHVLTVKLARFSYRSKIIISNRVLIGGLRLLFINLTLWGYIAIAVFKIKARTFLDNQWRWLTFKHARLGGKSSSMCWAMFFREMANA